MQTKELENVDNTSDKNNSSVDIDNDNFDGFGEGGDDDVNEEFDFGNKVQEREEQTKLAKLKDLY